MWHCLEKTVRRYKAAGGLEESSAKPWLLQAALFPPASCFPSASLTCTATRDEGESALVARWKKTEPHPLRSGSRRRGRAARGSRCQRRGGGSGWRGSDAAPGHEGCSATPRRAPRNWWSLRHRATFPGSSGCSGVIYETKPPAGPCLVSPQDHLFPQ